MHSFCLFSKMNIVKRPFTSKQWERFGVHVFVHASVLIKHFRKFIMFSNFMIVYSIFPSTLSSSDDLENSLICLAKTKLWSKG